MILPVLLAAASLLSVDRVSVKIDPQVRSTYLSLGKIVEDRPMQITNIRLGYDLGDFGRIGIRNWDVSSLTPRRRETHRRTLYHTEFGPTWEYDLKFAENWKLHNDLTCSWTLYRGFDDSEANKTYWWWQIDESVDNPYVVPFWRLRRCVKGNDYLYVRIGVRRRIDLGGGLYITPELALDGGNDRNQTRVFGRKSGGEEIGSGFYSISPRLELGWKINDHFTVYAWIEQYEVLGAARDVNERSTYKCAHNDWTHGGIGLRWVF